LANSLALPQSRGVYSAEPSRRIAHPHGDVTERTMHHPVNPFTSRLLSVLLVWLLSVGVLPAAFRVEPVRVVLDSPEATQQLLVTEGNSAAAIDRTRAASYKVVDPAVVTVDTTGLVLPKGEGQTEIVVRHGGEQVRVAVEVRGLRRSAPIS